MLRRFLDVQSSLWKSTAHLRSRKYKVLVVGSSSSERPSVGTDETRKPRKMSGSKCSKKLSDGPSCDKDIIIFDSSQADVQ